MVEDLVVSESDIGSSGLLQASALWAAGDSNPAPRIKRHVNPMLACIDMCSFVLVSAGMGLKRADIRVA